MDAKSLLRGLYRLTLTRPIRRVERPLIVWLVPFIGPKVSSDWAKACAILHRTLESVQAGQYDNWAVVVCCQERPPVLPEDTRIHFLSCPDLALAKGVSDHSEKVRMLARYAAERFDGPAYVSHLDADDLMHPGLGAFIASDNNGRGYLVDKGYMGDFQDGRIAEFGLRPGQRPFWSQCGSCGYFAVDFGVQRFVGTYLRLIGKGHKSYAARCAELGRPLDLVPFAAMVYMVNHGDNVQKRKGNDKTRNFERGSLEGVERAAMLAEFGLCDSAGPGGPFAVMPGR